ncbi:MAG: hypothetical protein ABIB71_05225 [Candidatus Woesearchaeota archaeon]
MEVFFPKFSELSSEEQLFSLMEELKAFYKEAKLTSLKMEEFFRKVFSPNSTIKVSGEEYSFAAVSKLVRYWDVDRDGSCVSCRHHCWDMERIACSLGVKRGNRCSHYSAYCISNGGKPARELKELVKDFLSKQENT